MLSLLHSRTTDPIMGSALTEDNGDSRDSFSGRSTAFEYPDGEQHENSQFMRANAAKALTKLVNGNL